MPGWSALLTLALMAAGGTAFAEDDDAIRKESMPPQSGPVYVGLETGVPENDTFGYLRIGSDEDHSKRIPRVGQGLRSDGLELNDPTPLEEPKR